MPISPTDFEVVDETKGKTDWSEFEPVAADPKALAFGVEQSLAMPALAMRGLSIGAEGVDPTRAFQERELRRSMGRIGGLMGDPGAAAGVEPEQELQATKDILTKPVEYGFEKAHEALAPALSDFLRTSGVDPSSTPEHIINLGKLTGEQVKRAGEAGRGSTSLIGQGLSLAMRHAPELVAGLGNLQTSTVESFAQPEQAALLLASGGESAVGRAASLLFASDQFASLPAQIREAINTIRDPNVSTADKVEAMGRPGIGVLFGAMMAKHGFTPGPGAQPPLLPSDRRLMDLAAKPGGITGADLELPGRIPATMRGPLTPGLTVPEMPAHSRLEIPEGASDPRVNEIRQKGFRDINQILAAFPDTLKGNREAARALRNDAFPEMRKDQSAEGIRSDQGQLDQTRPAKVGGEADRGDDVQQAPSGESQPVGAGEEGKTADEAQVIEKADEDFFQQKLGEIQGRAAKTINDEIVKTVQEKGWAGLDESDRRYLTPEQKAAYKAWIDAGKPEGAGKVTPPEEPPPAEPTAPPPTTPPTEPPAQAPVKTEVKSENYGEKYVREQGVEGARKRIEHLNARFDEAAAKGETRQMENLADEAERIRKALPPEEPPPTEPTAPPPTTPPTAPAAGGEARTLTQSERDFGESLAKKYGSPVAPTVPAAEPHESVSRFRDMLERAADKSKDEAELDQILAAAKGLPDESRIAWAVANNPHATAETFARAKANTALRGMTTDENIASLDSRRAELRKQRGIEPNAPAAPAAEAPAREFEKSSGFTFNPAKQTGGVKLEGLTDKEKAELEAAGQGPQWEFTDKRPDSPTKSLTFYVPEGSTLEQIKAAHEAKLKAEKPAGETKPAAPATEAPVAETKPAEGETPAPVLGVTVSSHRQTQRLVRAMEGKVGGGISMTLGSKTRLFEVEDTPKNRAEIERLGLKIHKSSTEWLNRIRQPEPTTAAPSTAEKVVSALESAADKARARLRSQEQKGVGGELGLGTFLTKLPNAIDYATIGAAKLARFGLDKAIWAAEMIREFGKRISPHLDTLFEDSKMLLARHGEIQKAKDTPVQELIDQASGAATAPKDTIRQIIDTLQSGLKTVRALKDHFTDAPQVSRAEVKLADDFLEADANRIKESLTDLVKRELPPSERGIFITAINNATRRSPILTGDPEAMYRRAAEVAGRIEERGIEVQKKTAINDIKANVTKALASPTVDLVFKSKIGDLVKGFTFTKPTEQTLARLKTLRDYVDRQTALGKDTAIPKAVLDTLDLLNKVPIKELPLHVLEALRDRIALLEEMGRRTVATRELRWENEKAAKNRELALEPTNPLDKRPEFTRGLTEGVSPLQAIGNLIKRRQDGVTLMDKALLPIDPMLDLLGDGKAEYRGWLFKHVRNPLDLGFNTAKVMSERITKPLVDIIERNKLGEQNARRIGVYAALKQEGGRERLMEMGATKAELDNIEKNLTPAEKQAYTSMREALDRLLPPVQKLMHELYNIPVEPVENYFPMPRDWKKVEVEPKTPKEPKFGEEIAFDDLGAWKDLSGDYTKRTTKEERGFTIERQKGAQTAIKINAFEVFQQHINDVAHLLSTQRDIKMIGELAKSDLFAEKYGKLGRNLVLDFVDTFARQGRMTGLHRWDVLDTMRKNTSVGVIGLRLASQFVHLSNVPLGMERAGPINYASGLAESWTPKGEQFLKDNFAETFARGGGEPALVEAQTEGGGSVFGKQIVPKSAVKAGFAIARWIDQKNAQATVLGVYLKELQAKGINPSTYADIPVDKEAQAHAMVMARRAVASPLPKDVPMVLSRGALTGGNVSLGRALFQFQNIFLDQWSNIRYDLPAYLRTDRVKAARIVFALTTMVAAETLIRETSKEAIKGLTGYKSKREPSTEGRVFTEVARRFPGVSQLMAMAMYPGSGIPILDTFKDIASGAYQAVTAKKAKAQDRGAIRAVSGTAQLLGVPGASQVGELIEKSQ